MTLGAATVALQCEAEAYRDKVFFIVIGFGHLVLRHIFWCRNKAGLVGGVTTSARSDSVPSGRTTVHTIMRTHCAHNRPTIVHCLGSLFKNIVHWYCFKKSTKMTPGNLGRHICCDFF